MSRLRSSVLLAVVAIMLVVEHDGECPASRCYKPRARLTDSWRCFLHFARVLRVLAYPQRAESAYSHVK